MAQRERRHSSFELDALVIVEMDVIINQYSGFVKGGWMMPVDAFCLKNREEILCHSIVIAISSS